MIKKVLGICFSLFILSNNVHAAEQIKWQQDAQRWVAREKEYMHFFLSWYLDSDDVKNRMHNYLTLLEEPEYDLGQDFSCLNERKLEGMLGKNYGETVKKWNKAVDALCGEVMSSNKYTVPYDVVKKEYIKVLGEVLKKYNPEKDYFFAYRNAG